MSDPDKRSLQRLVFRCVMEFLIRDAARLIRRHDGDFVRAIVFLATAQVSRPWGAHGEPRAVSRRAVSASLGLPYETTRRHLAELEARGFCVRVGAGVCAAPLTIAERDEAVERLGDVLNVVRDLKGLGLSMEQFISAPAPTDGSRRIDLPGLAIQAMPLIDTFLLRVLEYRAGGSSVDTLLFTAMVSANAQAISHDPVLAWRYAGADTPPPDHLREPVTATELAARLGLAHETVRRRLARLLDLRWCERRRGGYLVSITHMQSPNVIQSGLDSNLKFAKLLRDLSRIGVDLAAVGPAYSAEAAIARRE